MSAHADQTIRVMKMPTGPVRALPRRFARTPARRMPLVLVAVVVVAVVVLAAIATPLAAGRHTDRSTEAREVLRLLGR